MRLEALIVAAGSGERVGGPTPKQYRTVGGKPVLRHSVEAFLHHPLVGRVHVAIQPAHRPLFEAALAGLALGPPLSGGQARQDTVRLALDALAADPPDAILIHDAARPFVDPETIGRVARALDSGPAAIPALPVTDTLKRAADARVAATVPRDGLWRAQTPQGFRFAEILAAHRRAAGQALTDDAAVAEAAGLPVAIVAGDERNVKLTVEADFVRAEQIMTTARPDIRVGNGFDVHRFGPGDHVTLCGVAIPHEHGLIGHSDADVGFHALTDALLGAIGAGDIGQHFPPGEARWRGADSALFLRHAAALVAARGGLVAHADVTIICERPRIGPARDRMIAATAAALGVAADRVSIKATTTEGLGFAGRREGIAAQATATVRLR